MSDKYEGRLVLKRVNFSIYGNKKERIRGEWGWMDEVVVNDNEYIYIPSINDYSEFRSIGSQQDRYQ